MSGKKKCNFPFLATATAKAEVINLHLKSIQGQCIHWHINLTRRNREMVDYSNTDIVMRLNVIINALRTYGLSLESGNVRENIIVFTNIFNVLN